MTQDNRDYMIRTSTGLVPGLILAGLGVLFLLSNLDILQVYNWWQLWPVVVIAIGVTKLVDSPVIGEKTAGAVMIGVGGIFLATTFGWVPWDVLDFWPLALIGLGLVMLFQRLGDLEENSRWRYAARSQHADGIAFFGGFQRRVTTDDYGGADYVTIFGGAEIDLRGADIQADGAVVNITAIFGGVEIKVPEHWQVVNEAVGIFGGIEDKTAQPAPGTPGMKRLVVRGVAVFGGASFKN